MNEKCTLRQSIGTIDEDRETANIHILRKASFFTEVPKKHRYKHCLGTTFGLYHYTVLNTLSGYEVHVQSGGTISATD